VSDTASRNLCPSAVKRRIWGTMPAVETVIERASMQAHRGMTEDAAARMTSSVVEEGLAIPMNTTPRTGRSASARMGDHLATISAAWSCAGSRARPVAQKAQASAQPAWEETQTMYFFSLFSYALVSAPAAPRRHRDAHRLDRCTVAQLDRYLTKPSAAGARATCEGAAPCSAPRYARAARADPAHRPQVGLAAMDGGGQELAAHLLGNAQRDIVRREKPGAMHGPELPRSVT